MARAMCFDDIVEYVSDIMIESEYDVEVKESDDGKCWYAILPDGCTLSYPTETQACIFQQGWRFAYEYFHLQETLA